MVKKKDLKTKNLSELKENLGELRLDLLKSNSQAELSKQKKQLQE